VPAGPAGKVVRVPASPSRRVAVVTLGCARNEVDSEELAGRLTAGGWEVGDAGSADVLLVNTCGFVEAAKKDSVDTLLAAADTGKKVVAVGCLAERYGAELAASLPEADAVLGFDAYPEIGARLDDVLAGRAVPAHRPQDRRRLLPISPADRPAAAGALAVPGHASVADPGRAPAPGSPRRGAGAAAGPSRTGALDGTVGPGSPRRGAGAAAGPSRTGALDGAVGPGSPRRGAGVAAGVAAGPSRTGALDGAVGPGSPRRGAGVAAGPSRTGALDGAVGPGSRRRGAGVAAGPSRTGALDGAVGPGSAAGGGAGPGVSGWTPPMLRRRLDDGPVAPVKLASGCDRRCSFCAIPSFRGAFVSRPPEDLLAEAGWLAATGVREIVLVSENSTSYGKDLGDRRLLEAVLPELAAVPGIVRVRVCYLQPAELRPSLVRAIGATPGVAGYFDLSFQHASEPVLRRMRRFGSTEAFLGLLDQVRAVRPDAGVRSNVIVGFPGEGSADIAELERFLIAGRLDAVGVFGYSDEEGTEAASLQPKLARRTVAGRVERLSRLVEELAAQRAEQRVGSAVDVLVECVSDVDGTVEGRAEHQAPEADGSTTVHGCPGARVGDLVRARVTGSEGVDLVAEYTGTVSPAEPVRAASPAAAGGRAAAS